MIKAFYQLLFPWTIYFFRSIQISLTGIICHKADTKSAFMIAQRSCPHALSVNILTAFQLLRIRMIQRLIDISHMLPVHQIKRLQNLTARHKVHGCGYHIIGVFYADHVRIWIIQSCYRIYIHCLFLSVLSPYSFFVLFYFYYFIFVSYPSAFSTLLCPISLLLISQSHSKI